MSYILGVALALSLICTLVLLWECAVLGCNIVKLKSERDECKAHCEHLEIQYNGLEIHANALRVRLGVQLGATAITDFDAALRAQRKDGSNDA